MIQLRYTWFVSDNVTQIKEGDRLGIFNVKTVGPDRIVLTNREPIELKAGSSINLFGNLSFFVEYSDELRFYPTIMPDKQVMSDNPVIPEVVTLNDVPDNPVTVQVVSSPIAGRTEKAAEFEVVLVILMFLAAFISRRKIW